MSQYRSAEILLLAVASAARRMSQPFVWLRVFLRISFVLAGIFLTVPGEIVSTFVVVGCVLTLEWLMTCAYAPDALPPMCEYAPAPVILWSTLAAAFRSSSPYDDADEAPTRYSLEIMWCVYCVGITYHAKRPEPKSRGLLCLLHIQFCVMMMFFGAPPETFIRTIIRAGSFYFLAIVLYLEVPAHTCLIGRRGYNLCFLPILVVDYPVAAVFFTACWVAIYAGDLQLRQDWPVPEQNTHSEVTSTVPADVI